FYRFGFRPQRFELAPQPIVVSPGFELDLNGGLQRTDNADGWYAGGGIGTTWRLGDRFGLAFDLGFRYRDVQGSAIYQGSGMIGLPIVVVPSHGNDSLSWQV